MVYAHSDPPRYVPATVTHSVKILIMGSFGVGKTTLIDSVSEIPSLSTEERMTTASINVDPLAGLPDKSTTTVAMDFGRITLTPQIVLYLFGTPGQRRFWDLWAGLIDGAVGTLVLVDTRRLKASFEVLDQIETCTPGMPLAVAVNEFPNAPRHPPELLRQALGLTKQTPIVATDARERESAKKALIRLVEHALALSPMKAET